MIKAVCHCSLSISLIFGDYNTYKCLNLSPAIDIPPASANPLCLSFFNKLHVLELFQWIIPNKCSKYPFSWKQYNTPKWSETKITVSRVVFLRWSNVNGQNLQLYGKVGVAALLFEWVHSTFYYIHLPILINPDSEANDKT